MLLIWRKQVAYFALQIRTELLKGFKRHILSAVLDPVHRRSRDASLLSKGVLGLIPAKLSETPGEPPPQVGFLSHLAMLLDVPLHMCRISTFV